MTTERVRMAYLSMPAMLWAVQWSFESRPLGSCRSRCCCSAAAANPVSYTHLTLPTNREV